LLFEHFGQVRFIPGLTNITGTIFQTLPLINIHSRWENQDPARPTPWLLRFFLLAVALKGRSQNLKF
jgi:hypothetical protein